MGLLSNRYFFSQDSGKSHTLAIKKKGTSILMEVYVYTSTMLKTNNLKYDNILEPPTRRKDLIKLYLELTGIIKHFGHQKLNINNGFSTERI